MKTHGVEMGGHFVLSGNLGYFRKVVHFCFRVFSFDVSNGERVVGPEKSIHLVCNLKLMFIARFPEYGVLGVWVDDTVRLRLIMG